MNITALKNGAGADVHSTGGAGVSCIVNLSPRSFCSRAHRHTARRYFLNFLSIGYNTHIKIILNKEITPGEAYGLIKYFLSRNFLHDVLES